MNTIKPATPLPWKPTPWERDCSIVATHPQGHIVPVCSVGSFPIEHRISDAAYIVTACNAYPELVAALRKVEAWNAGQDSPRDFGIDALLAKLGEG